MMTELLIGSRDADHLSIRVVGRERPSDADRWDGNWVIAQLDLRAGGFRASVRANLRAEELHRLNEGLKFMRENLFGSAVLASMEDWIELTITWEESGGITITGQLSDAPGGNSLAFELPSKDQTYLDQWMAELDAIAHEYPVVGRP